MILKVTRNHGFTHFLEDTIFEKPQGGQIDPPPTPPPPPTLAVLGLKEWILFSWKALDLHEAVTFCIHDYFDMLIHSVISVDDLTVFLKQSVAFG